jgi:hypothetical protein
MIRNARFHRRGDAQRFVRSAEVVVGEVLETRTGTTGVATLAAFPVF